jgi:multidrug efflux pump subunit AcrB
LAACASILATFFVLYITGGSINTMVLGGLALALSRLIDNSVVVLENIFRHLEGGESPRVAAEKGGREVALPVLAGTLTTVVVFFPVTLLYGVSRFLFSALAEAVVISLFASLRRAHGGSTLLRDVHQSPAWSCSRRVRTGS